MREERERRDGRERESYRGREEGRKKGKEHIGKEMDEVLKEVNWKVTQKKKYLRGKRGKPKITREEMERSWGEKSEG